MKLRNIIFDLDGTLVDSARMTGQILDDMLADRGIALRADRDVIRAMDAVGGEAMIAAVMGAHTRDPAADLGEFRERHKVAATPRDLPFPGVESGLRTLASAGVAMAICSNKPQHLCEKILCDLDLARYFTGIVGSVPDRPRKPNPDAALIALDLLGVEAGGAIYCGDSLVDLGTARAAGIPMVLVDWGYGTKDVVANAPDTPVITDFDQLLRFIDADCQPSHD